MIFHIYFSALSIISCSQLPFCLAHHWSPYPLFSICYVYPLNPTHSLHMSPTYPSTLVIVFSHPFLTFVPYSYSLYLTTFLLPLYLEGKPRCLITTILWHQYRCISCLPQDGFHSSIYCLHSLVSRNLIFLAWPVMKVKEGDRWC